MSTIWSSRDAFEKMLGLTNWQKLVVYKKAYDTSHARGTRLTRINPNQNHIKQHTQGIIKKNKK